MTDIDPRTFLVDRFEPQTKAVECLLFDPGEERYPDFVLNHCVHTCLPYDGRHEKAWITVDISVTRDPDHAVTDVGPTRSIVEFETEFEPFRDIDVYNASCQGAIGHEYSFTIESEVLPSWIVGEDEITGYVTVDVTYDEEVTKEEQGLTDGDITQRREDFRELFAERDLEFGPDATPKK